MLGAWGGFLRQSLRGNAPCERRNQRLCGRRSCHVFGRLCIVVRPTQRNVRSLMGVLRRCGGAWSCIGPVPAPIGAALRGPRLLIVVFGFPRAHTPVRARGSFYGAAAPPMGPPCGRRLCRRFRGPAAPGFLSRCFLVLGRAAALHIPG